jgi:hypothetical protein
MEPLHFLLHRRDLFLIRPDWGHVEALLLPQLL